MTSDGVRALGPLRAAVLAALQRIRGDEDDVDVVLQDGVVHLIGSVSAVEDRDRVIRATQDVPGVRVVQDDVVIRSIHGRTRQDRLIAADVQDLLTHLPSLPCDGLRARVHRSVVVLSGQIPWDFQRDAVLDLLGGIRGVTEVVDAIDPAPGPRPRRPPIPQPHRRLRPFAD